MASNSLALLLMLCLSADWEFTYVAIGILVRDLAWLALQQRLSLACRAAVAFTTPASSANGEGSCMLDSGPPAHKASLRRCLT